VVARCKLKKPISIVSLFMCLASCHYPKDLLGTYRSNFAETGSLMTTIRLKPDSSFEYVVKGNSLYDSSMGKYQILDHKLFLTTTWERTGQYKWSLLERTPKIYRSGQDSVVYQSIFYFGDEKLFIANFETGKKITRAVAYNERKKYLLFGTHYYKKRWYLKRTE
jgi:hypothetical protein